ncbi:hypothetical protein [Lysobacter claricitrinus]
MSMISRIAVVRVGRHGRGPKTQLRRGLGKKNFAQVVDIKKIGD